MSLKLTQARQSGFTIVELLIVVVVIAILAAITIVSYNGITTQANDSAAKSTASTFQKKAELYYSVHSAYPTQSSDLNDSAESYHLTTGFTYGSVVADNDRSKTSVVRTCTTESVVTGLRIYYFNFTNQNWNDHVTLGSGTCAAVGTITVE